MSNTGVIKLSRGKHRGVVTLSGQTDMCTKADRGLIKLSGANTEVYPIAMVGTQLDDKALQIGVGLNIYLAHKC